MYTLRIFESISLLAAAIFWCEFVYYYFVFEYTCSGWPDQNQPRDESDPYLRLMIVADTHIMGMVNSARIDKYRREWQMKQSFSISTKVYLPDIIIFLGDLFDEASFSDDEKFNGFMADFEAVFQMDPNQARIVIPGNHDVGFHEQMVSYPQLLRRFSTSYGSVENIDLAAETRADKLNIVLANSMAFADDRCSFCNESLAKLRSIADQLDRRRLRDGAGFVEPIILHHIPFYRQNDTGCDFPRSLREKVKRPNVIGDDVMEPGPSGYIMKLLKPRLVISGHTHMFCNTSHQIDDSTFAEITVTSYNHKFAEKRPGFSLLSVNKRSTLVQHCYLIEEWLIVLVYLVVVLVISTRWWLLLRPKQMVKRNRLLDAEGRPRLDLYEN